MSASVPATQPKWINYGLWALQIFAAGVFFLAGGAKLIGVEMMVQTFEGVGIGHWFRYVTGIIEIGSAAAMLIPGRAWMGAALLIPTMIGAAITHLFLIGGSPVPSFVLLAICAIIFWFRKP